ncbi:MAG TPA: glycosyltransferase family 2 protein [Opitutaceae bacterium]|nr:glycosyltransferase family 2 protein [Opitutaceae bacterium]
MTVVSIIIPAYNRTGPLRATLASARQAIEHLGEPAEIVLVDDGSEPPLAPILADEMRQGTVRLLRQQNQGSIVARNHGLREAAGEFVLFLDSDDLIAPGKLRRHVERLRATGADITYDNVGRYDTTTGALQTTENPAVATGTEELVLQVQPAPHGPIYRRDYLRRALTPPLIPPLRKFDPVGDVWLYYNLCLFPGSVAKIDEPLTVIGQHDEERFSQHWERLGVASLKLMEAFSGLCPPTEATRQARMLVGERAFNSWRRLPRGFSAEFCRRQLAVWRSAPDHSRMELGGPLFRALARVLGPVGAGHLLRRRNAPYDGIRTISDEELTRLLAS